MKRRVLHTSGVLLLAVLVSLVVYQGSFSLGIEEPGSATWVLWAVSTLIFILMVTLGFMLVRTAVKLYVERRSNREGSRLKTKLVIGALALSFLPVVFLFVFSVQVLNHNLNKWFSRPTQNIISLLGVSQGFDREVRLRADATARWLAALPEIGGYLSTGVLAPGFPGDLCGREGIAEAYVRKAEGTALAVCGHPPSAGEPDVRITGRAPMTREPGGPEVVVRLRMPQDLVAKQAELDRNVHEYQELARQRSVMRWTYLQLLLLISLFVLFVATWIALMLSRQISGPISALVEAAGQLRRGNLGYRIDTPAIDELGTLVRAFNEMSAEIETSEAELERRRSFTEAILESIPTGVISLSGERRILRVNRALSQMLGVEKVARAERVEDLFPAEDAREIHYLLNRAGRTGIAGAQLDIQRERQTLPVAVTVSALVGKHAAGFVVVVEDTSDLLQAQRSAAWHEVARRIAHEMKNPLTPIALSAERIGRQVAKLGPGAEAPPEVIRILRECSLTISGEVQSVKMLVDEFSQFARFPAAQPVLSELNDVVENAVAVFQGRLDGIAVTMDLAADLPAVMLDREQFKRAVVNLVDNAAEAMQNSEEKRLTVATQMAGNDTIELTVSDTGHGIPPEDRHRLFLPYFSTKGRGTGLGLAIVHHIVTEHGAQVRVADNSPRGARFVIELPASQPVEGADRVAEIEA